MYVNSTALHCEIGMNSGFHCSRRVTYDRMSVSPCWISLEDSIPGNSEVFIVTTPGGIITQYMSVQYEETVAKLNAINRK